MKTKFYIITRMNVDCFPYNPHWHENNLNDDWLRARRELLRKYCYPSIINQSFTDFEWIVWCHPDTPDWMRNELAYMVNPIYADDLNEAIDWDADVIVTTRLDSDDLIHRDFMLNVHDHLHKFIGSEQTRQVYAFRHGYQYKLNAGPRGTIHNARRDDAPFLTLFSDVRMTDKDSLVYCERHKRMLQKFDHVINKDLSAWISVVHDDNLTGTGVGIRALADITKTFEQFGVKM